MPAGSGLSLFILEGCLVQMSDHIHERPAEDAAVADRWSSLLVTLTVGVLIVGAIVAGTMWIFATGSPGEDVAMLIVCITFALMITLMSVRELLRTGKQVVAKC